MLKDEKEIIVGSVGRGHALKDQKNAGLPFGARAEVVWRVAIRSAA
jgi:hypothetical protein